MLRPAVAAVGVVALLAAASPTAHLRATVDSSSIAACSIAVTSLSPTGGSVTDSVSVTAGVSSSCQIQSVVATVPGLTVPLTFFGGSRWDATLTVTAVPPGSFVLSVIATDVFGNAATRTATLFHRVPPTLTIESPEAETLARLTVHLKASCRDADGGNCRQFQVFGDSSPFGNTPKLLVDTPTTSVDQDVSLAQFDFDGKAVFLTFRGFGAFDVMSVRVQVDVENSPYFVETVRMPGPILDDADTHTLWHDDQNQAFIYDKMTGETRPVAGYASGRDGYLTPAGDAIFSAGFRAGELRVSGPWALYSTPAGLQLEDLRTRTTSVVDTTFGFPYYSVAPNGDVAYFNTQLLRYRNGTKTLIAPNNPGYISAPLTDGINVVYQSGGNLRLFTDPDNIPLGQGLVSGLQPYWDYALAGGWVAYTQEGPAVARNTWVRSPQGVNRQVTFFGDTVQIAALNSDGRVAVRHTRRLLLGQSDGPLVDIAGDWNFPLNISPNALYESNIYWRNNNLYMRVGRSVLRMVSAPPPGAPVNVSAVVGQGTQVRLTWSPAPEATSYGIKRGIVGGTETVIAAGVSGTTFTDTTSLDGITYYYVVSAANPLGEGPNSTEVVVAMPLLTAKRLAGNFDGDRRADLTVFRPSTGHWYIARSRSTYSLADAIDIGWGLWGDVPVTGDFDGDGETDVVVFRPSSGAWFVLLSSTGYNASAAATYQWGAAGDIPMPADYDGDGRTDLAVYHPSTATWYIHYSSNGTAVAYQWGTPPGDVPIAADVDGDGRADLVIYRPSDGTWYFRTSTSGYTSFIQYQWGGVPGDVPVATDFDGDGRMDLAIYRPSEGMWYLRFSSSGYSYATWTSYQWGQPGDVPVIADVDGDGRADLVVWRPSNGTWYVRFSSVGWGYAGWTSYQWGQLTDIVPGG